MRTRTTKIVIVMAGIALAVTPALASAGSSYPDTARGGSAGSSDRDSLRAIGLTGNGTQLVRFDTDRPGDVRVISKVAGLQRGERLIGIDYRVQDGRLYGVGDQGGIYTVKTDRARATKVSQLSVPLQGRSFGVDFNPAANALRVISDTGQNLRHPFATTPAGPTVVDGTLNNAGVTAIGLTGAAYTNNDLDADTGTTLYDIDTALDQVSIQAPANDGDLSANGLLGRDVFRQAGFDIYSTLRAGTTVDLTGFATLNTGSGHRLYEITLFSGSATDLGSLKRAVTDLAIPLDQR